MVRTTQRESAKTVEAANSSKGYPLAREKEGEPMKTEKKKRGRPRKQGGKLKFKDFVRAEIVMCAYDEVRKSDQKHSGAVKEAVAFGKRLHPEMSISETGLRRDLAAFRPRTNRSTLIAERSPMTEGDVARLRGMLEQVPPDQRGQGAKADLASEMQRPMPRTKYMLRFAERPTYPRYNRRK